MKKAITLDRSSLLSNKRRIVIKVGSAVLASSESGLDQARIERLASEISALLDKGRQVILVSSGAIAAGFASITPLQIDLTRHTALVEVERWLKLE